MPPEKYLKFAKEAGFVDGAMLGWTEFRTSATTRNANFVFSRPL